MPDPIRFYHLHKYGSGNLHFEVNHARAYVEKNWQHCFKPHRHSFYQVIWFSTPGQHHIDYQTWNHPANALFFVNKNQVHHFCEQSANEGFLFHFNDAFLSQHEFDRDLWMQYQLFNELSSPLIEPDAGDLSHLEQLRSLILLELGDEAYNYRSQVYHLFQVLLLKIERIKRSHHEDISPSDAGFKTVVQFRALIDRDMNQSKKVVDFARELGISAKSLTNLTKRFLNQTPAEIIAEQKVIEAKRLLSNTSLSIKEIAYKLGFDQATYFTKYFKKLEGITPKAFASQVR